MRRSLLVVLTLLVLSLLPYPSTPAAASCAAPSVSLEGALPSAATEPEVRRGEEVTVLGRGFVEGCDDTGTTSVLGCSGEDRETQTPLTAVELVLLQGRPTPEQTSLAVADAGDTDTGELGQVTWAITIPSDASLGRATLKTVGSEPLVVRIVE